MLNIVFTLDYEVHGNGDGCPYELMVEPTSRLLNLCDRYGAKLTIMADVAEILRFKGHCAATGRDEFYSEAIESQLREAVQRGHDVQLHLHSSWFNARLEGGRWRQDWSEYSFADLPTEKIDQYLVTGKEWLENLLKPVDAGYRCTAFRAANWSMQPSGNAARALVRHGFQIETSVFKWGIREGRVSFDYSRAHHHMRPWRANLDDICLEDAGSHLWELPIYSELRWMGAFFSPYRIYRACVGKMHRMPRTDGESVGPNATRPKFMRKRHWNRLGLLTQRHAWKADFNQCTGRQLVRAVERACGNAGDGPQGLPFVMIGHSKLFTRSNGRSLEAFLRHVSSNSSRCRFATLTACAPVS